MKRTTGLLPDLPALPVAFDLETGAQVIMSCHTVTGRRVFSCHLTEPTSLNGDLVVNWPVDATSRPAAILPAETMLLEVSNAYDALYLIEARIEPDRTLPADRLRLRGIDPWNRVQRRKNVRMAAVIIPRVAELVTGSGAREPLPAFVRDISGGGVLLRSERELEPGEMIDLAFELPNDSQELRTTVLVGRVAQQDHKPTQVWEIGCRFTDLSEQDRDRVVRFIFAEQREIAKIRRARRSS
jgi:hypothetical protein